MAPLVATYVLPLSWLHDGPLDDLSAYLAELAMWVDEVMVVDGSPPARYDDHHRRWGATVTHLRPDPDLHALNGKVDGVLTGMRRAGNEYLVVADDDVRYDRAGLETVIDALARADLVRPQNYFSPVPWHARWDTARSLLNRTMGADFPGTLAVRRSALRRVGGYDGDVLFENLELIRTVEAAGGNARTLLDCYVRRVPPTTGRFVSQRVRQAYDELARPLHLAVSLAMAPAAAVTVRRHGFRPLAAAAAACVAVAEVGRRRAGGRRHFPATCSLFAPVWLAERAVCVWAAVGLRLVRGGCPYRGVPIPRAATPVRELRRRTGEVRIARVS
ncbi:MAG: glycosyltransferase [Acidimicrobiales bacterium]